MCVQKLSIGTDDECNPSYKFFCGYKFVKDFYGHLNLHLIVFYPDFWGKDIF